MARKRKKKGDPLGQWKEAFGSEEDSDGSETPPPPGPVEKVKPPRAARPDPPKKPAPPEPEEVEAEVEAEEEGEEGAETFVEGPSGEGAYWREENGGSGEEPPVSEWERSLQDVGKEEEDGDAGPAEEEEEEFSWPTVKDAMDGGPAGADATRSGGTPAEGPALERIASEEGERMETPNDKAARGGAGELESIGKTLDSAVGELADLRKSRASAVTEGLRRAGEMLDAQHRRVMDLLRSNENLAREARLVQTSVEKRREAKAELEVQIGELKDLVDQLSMTGDRLAEEKASLSEQKDRAGSDNERMKGEVQSLRESIERLTNERVELDAETADLEKKRDHIEEDVRRLTKLKEEYLANIARFREDG